MNEKYFGCTFTRLPSPPIFPVCSLPSPKLLLRYTLTPEKRGSRRRAEVALPPACHYILAVAAAYIEKLLKHNET